MTNEEKVELVRKNVLIAVQKYKDELVGRRFLYIFDDSFIEVIFKVESFMHLTGVSSKKLNPVKFYERAKDKKLKRNHMYFSTRYPLKTALKKSKELADIDIFSNSKIFVIMDMETNTYRYAFTFSDKKMTLGLTKDTKKDSDENEVELDYYVPKTFRVKEDATEGHNEDKVKEIIMILSKVDAEAKYTKVHYSNNAEFESFSTDIKEKIDENLIANMFRSKKSEDVSS